MDERPFEIVLFDRGKATRLTTAALRNRAVAAGDLTPDTRVTLRRPGEADRECLARDAPELLALFPDLQPPPVPPAPPPPLPPPPALPAAETVAIAAVEPSPARRQPPAVPVAVKPRGSSAPRASLPLPPTPLPEPPPRLPQHTAPVPSPASARDKPAKKDSPVALIVVGLLLVGAVSMCRNGQSSPETTAADTSAAAAGDAAAPDVTLYATRTVSVRESANRKSRRLREVTRGERLMGITVPDAEGRAPWLKLYGGGYVWTANLSEAAPPDLEAAFTEESAVPRATAVSAGPDAQSATLEVLAAGTRITVVGRLANGWYEIWRPMASGGGVGYVPEETFFADRADTDSAPSQSAAASDESEPSTTTTDAMDAGSLTSESLADAEPEPRPAPDVPFVISSPDWERRPGVADFAPYFPDRALR